MWEASITAKMHWNYRSKWLNCILFKTQIIECFTVHGQNPLYTDGNSFENSAS